MTTPPFHSNGEEVGPEMDCYHLPPGEESSAEILLPESPFSSLFISTGASQRASCATVRYSSCTAENQKYFKRTFKISEDFGYHSPGPINHFWKPVRQEGKQHHKRHQVINCLPPSHLEMIQDHQIVNKQTEETLFSPRELWPQSHHLPPHSTDHQIHFHISASADVMYLDTKYQLKKTKQTFSSTTLLTVLSMFCFVFINYLFSISIISYTDLHLSVDPPHCS